MSNEEIRGITYHIVKYATSRLIPDADLEDRIYDLDDLRGTVRLVIGDWSIIDVLNAARFLSQKYGLELDDVTIEQNYAPNSETHICLVINKKD